jgi:hypothetical protein
VSDDDRDDENLVVLDPLRVVFRQPDPPPIPGQTVKYSPVICEEICHAVAVNPKGLDTLCRENKRWPSFVAIYNWRVKYEEFNRAFMLAQRMRAAMFMDQIVEITDDAANDLIEVEGRMLPNPVSVQRAKLRAEFRERVAKRLDPATWGDKIEYNQHPGYLPQDDVVRLLK